MTSVLFAAATVRLRNLHGVALEAAGFDVHDVARPELIASRLETGQNADRTAGGVSEKFYDSLDILDELPSIKVCTRYEANGKVVDTFPASLNVLSTCKPVYEELPGWQADTSGARCEADLPENARQYIKFLEKNIGVPASMVSVGSDRKQVLKI